MYEGWRRGCVRPAAAAAGGAEAEPVAAEPPVLEAGAAPPCDAHSSTSLIFFLS